MQLCLASVFPFRDLAPKTSWESERPLMISFYCGRKTYARSTIKRLLNLGFQGVSIGYRGIHRNLQSKMD